MQISLAIVSCLHFSVRTVRTENVRTYFSLRKIGTFRAKFLKGGSYEQGPLIPGGSYEQRILLVKYTLPQQITQNRILYGGGSFGQWIL
jgi:hypothetical protein